MRDLFLILYYLHSRRKSITVRCG